MVEIKTSHGKTDVIVTVPPFRERSDEDILLDAIRELKVELMRRYGK